MGKPLSPFLHDSCWTIIIVNSQCGIINTILTPHDYDESSIVIDVQNKFVQVPCSILILLCSTQSSKEFKLLTTCT